jgi:hypothetical protein
MAKSGNMAVDGADPRIYDQMQRESRLTQTPEHGVVRPHQRMLHDSSVTFEEYYYYAQQTRAEEHAHPETGREMSL